MISRWSAPLHWALVLVLCSTLGSWVARAESTEEAPSETNAPTRVAVLDEAAISGSRRYNYEPAGRRDPFRSLVEKVSINFNGPRPTGITGMLIAEVDLVGIVKDPDGDLAFFNGSDSRGYFLRVGDELYDGTITRIDERRGRVIFRQEVNDPRLIKPFREVVKELNPGEEGNP
jgi:type IV pilus assembly protein PilP